MTNLTLGSTYRKGYIDIPNEIVPQIPAFKSYPYEEHIFEEREAV